MPYRLDSLQAYKVHDAYNYVVPGHLQKILYQDIGKAFGSEFPFKKNKK